MPAGAASRGDRLDRPTLEALYVRLERPVYNVVYRWTWEPEVARELTQDTFVRLWGMRDRVRVETVEALVFQIAVNLVRRRRRWRSLRTFFGIDEQQDASRAPGPEALALGTERALAVRAAVEALPQGQRDVVVLCHFSGLSYREVGEILGIPEGTVGSRRTLALKRLRADLERHDAD
jgi:RNA polymerase sigma-70 factor (ECF subfamily)